MIKTRYKLILTIFALLLAIYPVSQVQAKVQDFSSIYLELNLPEDTIVLTRDTPNDDKQWYKSGITDPKKEKKEFAAMNVQAILYDPGTDTTVRLIQKQSKDSREIFHLSQLSEKEFTDFLNGLFTSNSDEVTSSVEKYPQKESPFFRLCIKMVKDEVPSTEVIYGTIINGYSISFDLYRGNSAPPIDESYIQKLVAGAHFTEFLDKAEVQKQERELSILIYVLIALFIVLIITLIIISKRRNKKNEVKKKNKALALEAFLIAQKQKDLKNIKDPVLFVNKTTYSEGVIKSFLYYNKIFRSLKLWSVTAILYLFLLVSLYNSTSSFLYYILAIVILFAFIYYQGIMIEKTTKQLITLYKKNQSMEAIFTFYEDYYTLSGIQSESKYPYLQISDIREYKGYLYVYLNQGKAVYLKKDGFEQEYSDFIEFLKQKIS